MTKINKILFFSFLILVFILIGEILFFIFETSIYPLNALVFKNKIDPKTNKIIESFSGELPTIRISETMVIKTFKGYFIDLIKENKTYKDENTGIYYDTILLVKHKNDTTPRTFLYNSKEIKNAKKTSIFNNKSRKISLDDLKNGDLITIKETIDLSKEINESLVKLEIIKVN